MELHSYAKRRPSKKWSVEQKRQLVETRIAYDSLFENQPSHSVLPWKKILSLAKLDDFNVYFVRKQWANMIDKYKQYKQNRLGDAAFTTKCIDNEMIEKMTEEWEFFKTIHQFMTKKTTNLHSYALTSQPPLEPNENLEKPEEMEKSRTWHKPDSNPSNGNPLEFSSDTNDYDYAASVGIKNDHDFYSKKTLDKTSGVKLKLRPFYPEESDDTRESMLMELTTTAEETVEIEEDTKYSPLLPDDSNANQEKQVFSAILLSQQGSQQIPSSSLTLANLEDLDSVLNQHFNQVKEEPLDHDVTMAHCEETSPEKAARISSSESHSKKSPLLDSKLHLNERDKYYRHKRRFNRRLEKRFDALLNVFGQIVKSEYPSIDVSPLINQNSNSVQSNGLKKTLTSFASKVFSSSDEMTSADDEDHDNTKEDDHNNENEKVREESPKNNLFGE